MAEDIGSLVVKVGMDSRLFQDGVTTLNKKMNLLQSEFKATASNVKVFGSSTEQMNNKVEYLSKTIDLQKAKVQQLAQAYEKTKAETGEYSNQTIKAGTSLNNAISYLNKLEQELGDTTKSLATQTSGWINLSKSMTAASEKMKSTGQSLANIGRGLTTGVTLPILGIGTAATKMAMDAVESENLFEVSFGNMAGSARKWSQDVSKSLGLNAYEVRKNSATYYTMLSSMGLTEKEAYKMSTSFTQLAYDMASFYNLKPEEAFDKLKAGITGETEPLKSLGVLINQTTMEAYAMENGIGKLTKTKKGFKLELSETDKVMARYGLIMKSTAKAQGDLGRTMDSPTNKMRIMTEQLKQQGIELGVKLIPLMEKGLNVVSDIVDWLNNLNDEQRDMIIKFGLAAAAAGPLISTLGSLVSVSGGVVGAVGKISSAFGTAKIATAGIGTAAEVATGAAGVGGLAGLSSSLGGLALAAAPWIVAGAAVAGTGYLIYKGLTEETIPAVDLFAEKVEYTSETVAKANGEMAVQVESNVIKISDSTKKAVGAYIELDKKAADELMSLKINSTTITGDIAKELISTFIDMGKQIKDGLKKDFDDEYKIMQDFYANSKALSSKEEADSLKTLEANYEFQKNIVDGGTKEIEAIYKKASAEHRKTTEEEDRIISNIRDNMKTQAIKTLSENELEAQVILQRMADYDKKITADMASQHIKQLNDSRNKAVNIANEEYEKRVAALIKMRDESKSISAQQAATLIEDAKRQRDGIVKSAEDTRKAAVDRIFGMNEDLAKNVDATTGNILNKFQKLFTKWDQWKPDTKNFNWSLNQLTANKGQMSSGIPGNATGTSSWQGGLTTLHEKGYEVYDLPRGTRIYNHQASEDMIIKTAEAVAKQVVASSNTGSGITVQIENFNNARNQDVKAFAEELEFYRKQKSLAYGGAY